MVNLSGNSDSPDTIFDKKQLLQMRDAGANFYPAAPDGQKRGMHKDKPIALNKDAAKYRKLQPTEEFESAIKQKNFVLVLTEGSRLVIIDKDTEELIRIGKDKTLCTYRDKNGKNSEHYFLIAKSDEDVEKFARADKKMDGLEVFTHHKNNVLCIQGHYRIDNEASEPKRSWCLRGGDLQKQKAVPVVGFEDVSKNIPQWNDNRARPDNRVSDDEYSTKVPQGGRHDAAVPAGRGKRHNAILKECFRFARRAKKDGLNYGYLYGKITGSPRIEGMEEYEKGSAKHPELADMINFVLENQTDTKFGAALVRGLHPYAHIEDGPKADQLNCWFYAGGKWHDNTIHMVLTELLKFESEEFRPTSSMAKTIAENLSTAPRTLKVVIDVDYREMRKMMFIDRYGNYYDIGSRKVRKIDPTIHFYQEVDAAFRLDEDAPEAEKFVKFLKSRFGDDWELVLYHYAGSVLHPSILGSKPKALNIIGDHDTYKSLLEQLTSSLIDLGSISNMTADQMSHDPVFAKAQLANKILNQSDEEEVRTPKNPGQLKDVITKGFGVVRDMNTTKLKYVWRYPRWVKFANKVAPHAENDEDDSIFIREMYVRTLPVADDEPNWYDVLDINNPETLQKIGMYILRKTAEIYTNPKCMVTQSLGESRRRYKELIQGDLEDFIEKYCEKAGDTTGVGFLYLHNRFKEASGSSISRAAFTKRLEDGGREKLSRVYCRAIVESAGTERPHTYQRCAREESTTQATLIMGLKMNALTQEKLKATDQ